MKQHSRKVFLLLISIPVAWALWINFHSTDDSFVQHTEEQGIEELVTEDIGMPEPEQTQSTMTQASDDGPTDKRIVHVPDAEQDPGNDQELIRSVSDDIESALAGYAEEALEFVGHIYKCRNVGQNEKDLRVLIEFFGENKLGELTISDGISGSIKIDSYEDWSAAKLDRFEYCRTTRELFNDDLRTRLKMLAENGNANARFMYAMWPPVCFPCNLDQFFEWLEYEKLASDFTWQNISDRNPLGLLALGLSYRSSGLFTARKHEWAAFVIAAEKCGLKNDEMDSILNAIRKSDFNRAKDISEEIVRVFCD